MFLQVAFFALPHSIVEDKKDDPKEMTQNVQDELKLL
jgi:hypothetical protein